MLGWLSKLIFGKGEEGGALIRIEGAFYDQPKAKWRCVAPRAEAAVVGAGGPFAYNLVVALPSAGDAESDEDADEDEEEKAQGTYVFPLGAQLHLFAEAAGTSDTGGAPAIVWQSPVPGGVARHMFAFDEDAGAHMHAAFRLAVARALWERANGRSAADSGVSESALLAIIDPRHGTSAAETTTTTAAAAAPAEAAAPQTPKKPALYPELSSPQQQQQQQQQQTSTTAAAEVTTPERPIPASMYHELVQTAEQQALVPPPAQIPGLAGETLVQVPAELYLFDQASQTFVLQQAHTTAAIQRLERFRFGLFVLAAEGGQVLVGQPVCNEMFMFFNQRDRAMIWIYKLGGTVWTWSAKFGSAEDDRLFKDRFARCLFEATRCEDFDRALKEEDRAALLATMRDDVPEETSSVMDPEDGMTDEDLREFEPMDTSQDHGRRHSMAAGVDEDEDEDEDDEEEEHRRQRGTNKLLVVSGKHNRALVVRGSQIGVFSTEADRTLKYQTRINAIADTHGATFSPRRVMLHQGEDALMMLHPSDHRRVLRMDLNRGDVVEEWAAHEDYPVSDILPQDKYAPHDAGTSSFVGMNRVGFFVVDPRQTGATKVVQNKSFFSLGRTAPGFTCGATTSQGQLAMATERGEIRLYDHKMLTKGSDRTDVEGRQPRAKTTWTGFGDAVIGIDVTADGKWVLATCKTYLLLIPTDDVEGRSAFEKPLGKKKAAPRRLQIKPEHLRLMGGVVNFTPAKFNQGADRERAIVTSSGPFIITWNFRKARQNVLDHYQIIKLGSDVVADQFRFGDADSVVVAMPDDVTMATRVIPESFRRRSTIAPPRP